jgi:Mor family transcriptional regulator
MNDKWLDEVSEDQIPEAHKPIVAVIGLRLFIQLCHELGGTQPYLPMPDTIVRPIRNKLIKQEFNGSNYQQLALKYGLSERWVRDIINPKEIDGQMNILEYMSEVNL